MNFVESNKNFIQNNPLNEKEGHNFSFSKLKIQHFIFSNPPPFGNYNAKINEEYVMI
jgi:hypothetical protein